MAGRRERFARGANAHLIDDETVAKMGHPDVCRVISFRLLRETLVPVPG